MKSSLIVLLKNNITTLPLLLESLKQQTEKEFEVILAHDGYSEELENNLKSIKGTMPFQITYLSHNDNCYRREAMLNNAISLSQSDYLIFIEDGTILHHKFIAEHLRLSRYGKVVAARKVSITKELLSEITPQLISQKKIHSHIKYRLLWKGIGNSTSEMHRITNGFLRHFILDDVWQGLSTDNFSLYKEDMMAANGFDERFDVKSEESDFELELRLMQAGVFTKEERRIATLYKVCGEETKTTSEISSNILEESSKNNLSWTPYGIIKEDLQPQDEE